VLGFRTDARQNRNPAAALVDNRAEQLDALGRG
jgi:hypothetical protein